ncbi:MAG: Ig-like domain-containing protein [Candidatus Krumholzibacteriota bacterium]|nr:Ig-like domain-containing protein [Candidatus Krumholzibacteriota bacterium]
MRRTAAPTRLLPFLVISVLLAAAAGCDEDALLPPDGAPRVLATSPAEGDTLVPVDAAVTVFFDRFMDRSTISSGSFTLDGPTGPVDATVATGERSATLSPRSRLAGHSLYTARLDPGIADAQGAVLGVPYAWSFTTGVANLRLAPDAEFTVRDLGPDGAPDEIAFGGPPGRHLFAGAADGYTDRAVIEFPLDAIATGAVLEAILFFNITSVSTPGGATSVEFWGFAGDGDAGTGDWDAGFLIQAIADADLQAGTTYACLMTEAINAAIAVGAMHVGFRLVVSGGAYAEIASTTDITSLPGPTLIAVY